MKRLSDERTKLVFEKLSKFIGTNVKLLIDRPDGQYVFREHKDRIYYVSEKNLKLGETIAPDHFVSIGTCFGKFTKTGRFMLHITALNYLAPYAQFKIWLKPSAEQQFLYGHNVNKAGLGRITESTQKYQGVIVFSMNDLPLDAASINFINIKFETLYRGFKKILTMLINNSFILGFWSCSP
ncbi:60S ribosome subunit biogenesis protein NIP7 homolog isoform X1 [Lycorma delicatula]|uniref:60S ribosome subunit biogenesis protein NIP7 homolog isoform X1 n=1 Tax=Lycorma delicatula TaxID=130591 RepID=UPI003F50DA79